MDDPAGFGNIVEALLRAEAPIAAKDAAIGHDPPIALRPDHESAIAPQRPGTGIAGQAGEAVQLGWGEAAQEAPGLFIAGQREQVGKVTGLRLPQFITGRSEDRFSIAIHMAP